MGSIKDRNGMDLTEEEDIKERWQEYTEELYKKDLNDPENLSVLQMLSWNHFSRARPSKLWKDSSGACYCVILWLHFLIFRIRIGYFISDYKVLCSLYITIFGI